MAMAGFDIDDFLDAARSWRPKDYDVKMKRRQRFLEGDVCETDLIPELQRHYPETWREMVPVVRNIVPLVVNERAKAFKRSRFRLARDGQELADDDDQVRLFDRVWREAQMQIRLEELNRYTENANTCFLRIGWDAERKRLRPQIFQPQHVQVVPNPDDICDLDSAVGIALRIASDSGIVPEPGRERWEFWSRDSHFIALGSGEVLPPAEDNQDGENPYAPIVPIIAFLAQPPDKGLFTLAGEDLIAEALAQSAAATDIDFIGKHQGFGEIYVSGNATVQKELDAEKRVRSPHVLQMLPQGASLQHVQPNPLVSQLNDVAKDRLKHTALLHGLPAGSVLSEARTVAAAEALAIERISLEEYREESVARYREAVARLWRVVRAVWNARAVPDGLPGIDDDLDLVWYPGDLRYRSTSVPMQVPEVMTPNQWLERLGEGPLRKPDGSLDPDGNVPMFQLRMRGSQAAAVASVGSRLGGFSFSGASGTTPGAATTSGSIAAREPPAVAGGPAGEGGASRPTTPARPAAAAPTPGTERAADTALNGAQVQAASQVVKDVAAGQLPRQSGVKMLEIFFRLSADEAEQIMGDVGKSFTPKAPPADAVTE